MKTNSLKKDYIWNTVGALTISATSLIYTVIMSRFCNLNDVGIFSFAFSFACMIVTLASFGGRTFQVTDTKGEIKTSTYIITRYITVLLSYLLVIIFALIKNYNIEKTLIILILCIFKFLEELSDVYYGILQKRKKLYKVGQYQFIKSIINIILFCIGIIFIKNLIVTVLLITLNNTIFLFCIERKKAEKLETWHLKFDKKEIIALLEVNFYICGFTFFSTYLINAPKYAIDTYLTNDIQAIFNMLIMPATLMLLIGGFIINPILVDVAEKYEKRKNNELKSMITKVICYLLLFGVLALIASYFLGTWALGIIYGLSFTKYKTELLIVIVGAILYTFVTILGQILIAFRKIKIQLVIAVLCSIFAYVISNVLVPKLGLSGGIYSYLITMIFRTICYIPLIFSIFKKGTSDKNEKN